MPAMGTGTSDFAWDDATPFVTGPSRLINEGAEFYAATEYEFALRSALGGCPRPAVSGFQRGVGDTLGAKAPVGHKVVLTFEHRSGLRILGIDRHSIPFRI
jgi:hypothetical protein